MEQDHQIRQLLLKFANNQCSPRETEILRQYFEDNPDQGVLPEVQEVLNMSGSGDFTTNADEAEALFAKISAKIGKAQVRELPPRPPKPNLWWAAAAIFVGLLGVSLYLYKTPEAIEQVQTPIATQNSIILEREDGKVEVLSEDGQIRLTDKEGEVIGGQTGRKLTYQKKDKVVKELVYNTLRVPYGKRFELNLSDGSRVFMNAGSSLKYPVNFSKTGNRQVFLTGEAFFKVSKDNSRPFQVAAENLEIDVLGTEFNVSAYPEDLKTSVVLVEGSVQLAIQDNTQENIIMQPGQLASLWQRDSNIEVQDVDVAPYIAWLQGDLVFRNMSFENILKKMERHYDVKIINNDAELAKEIFNASFGSEPLVNILEYFKETYGLNFVFQNKNTVVIGYKEEE
ncbi:FecR domain-containing protein [Arenibacter sp. F26102]|uniref:FecR family protein n=1 Tax=Arenibacter sp. F26102 TaxID=2926416 RepID=UPI001FF2ABEC|nr:FecR family protein [Arenibacter sp. F26102]MCK0147645.1 FecR domain-containing protein [Arenibacter sp. F26102]